jgi:hypothetical protein
LVAWSLGSIRYADTPSGSYLQNELHPFAHLWGSLLYIWTAVVLGTCVLIAYVCYQVVLDSDAGLFGGFGRIHHDAEHFTTVRLVPYGISYYMLV